MGIINKFEGIWEKSGSLLCVGLDPDLDKMPEQFRNSDTGILDFLKAIVDATGDLVCAFKPNIAFFSAYGAEDQLEELFVHIQSNFPEVPIILDSKRSDIGNTARQYAREAFERFNADAVTVNPLLGSDSIEPFLEYEDRGVIILTRTSNPSAGELQDLEIDGIKLSHHIAKLTAEKWNKNGNCMLVIGAPYPEELAEIRKIVGDMPFLVPGVGAQGGAAEAVLKNGLDSKGAGLIINSSRGVLYASNGADFAEKARSAAQELVSLINAARSQ